MLASTKSKIWYTATRHCYSIRDHKTAGHDRTNSTLERSSQLDWVIGVHWPFTLQSFLMAWNYRGWKGLSHQRGCREILQLALDKKVIGGLLLLGRKSGTDDLWLGHLGEGV